jgi:uncharacterized protein YndB with AHSA1/START domain
MPKVETTVQIDAPPERVFELLMDPSRLSEWVTANKNVSDVPEGGLKVGSSFTQTLSLARRTFKVHWEVDEVDAPRVAVWTGEGPKGSSACVRYELTPSGDGTSFRYVNDFELPGGVIGNAAGKISSRPAQHAMTRSLKKLQKIFRSGH